MSDAIYQAVLQRDSGVAEAYKNVAPKDDETPIDKAGAQSIYNAVIDTDTKSGKPSITPSEAAAFLLVVKNHAFTDDAHQFFQQSLMATTKAKDMFLVEALFEGGAGMRVKDKSLGSIMYALNGVAASGISFTSPGTQIEFWPMQYAAISQLIQDGKIEVYAMNDGGFTREYLQDGGKYNSNFDRLVLFNSKDVDHAELTVLLIHEATHAIQDWFDKLTGPVKMIEADAYIAGAVAINSIDPNRLLGGPYKVAFKKAVPFVINGTATASNKAWKDAYQLVVDEVAKDVGHGAAAKKADKKGQNEKAIMEGILTKLQAEAIAKAVKAKANGMGQAVHRPISRVRQWLQ